MAPNHFQLFYTLGSSFVLTEKKGSRKRRKHYIYPLMEEAVGCNVAGGRGELRCLGGETDTSCSYGVYMFVC